MSKFCMGCMEQYGEEFEICPYCGYAEGSRPEQALHMEPGSILRERYIIGKALGFGGFGVTYLGWDALLEHKVAIKEYLPSEFSTRMPGVTQVTVYSGDKTQQFNEGLSRFVDEAKKLAKFNNVDGIVKIYDSFEENNTAYIVMEYLEGQTLADRLAKEKTIPPEEAIKMLMPVIESLDQVHKQGIIHRDIAPDNLFITKNGQVKVIDFGAARFATTSHSRSLTVIIKPGFSPEEQYRSRAEQGAHTDVYAIAATLYKMITGITPPEALERYAMAEGKNKDILEPISKYCKDIDADWENAILNALNIRIEDRTPTMEAFRKELQAQEPVKRVYGSIKRTDTLRWPLWAKIAVPIAALAVVVFGVLFALGVVGFQSNLRTEIQIPDGMTRVPSVVNQTTDAAELRITEAVLLYMVAGKEYSAEVPADYVLSQDMTGGIVVQQNSIVSVIVSGGAKMVRMPSVANLPISEATKLLTEAGFVVSTIEEYSIAIENGYVISQDVEAEEMIAEGTVITIVVSKGADPNTEQEKKEFELPNLIGKTYDEVLAIAETNGFKLSVVAREYSTEYAANEIMRQSPNAGSTIVTGDVVKVAVSLGKNTIKVPNVQYQTKMDAKAALEALGLKVTITEVESETIAAGLVITQSIAANTSVDPGTSITLTVSKGAGSFAMPNVVGMTEANAKSTLTGKGLSVSVTYEFSSKAAGTVLKQSIAENTQVTRGTSVTITVSSGEETVIVPNVLGQTSSAAQAALKNKGFAVTVNKVYSDSVAADKVISQTPDGGSSQVKGSTVIITVSLGKDTIQSISIATKPGKLSYFVGEILNPAGMTLTAKYKSGTTQTVTGGYTCSPTALNTVGTTTITVTYEGCAATFDVSVKDVVLSSISIKTKPSKTSYYVGDALDTSGLVLTVTYSNGTKEEVTGGFTCTPTILTTVGTQSVSVKYYGKTATFSVTVKEVILTEISVKTMPLTTSYFVSDTLNMSGLTLTATYNNGATETVFTGFTCTPTTLNTAGIQTITVHYEGMSTTFTVSVQAVLTGISVKTMPTKTSYYEGDMLNINGLTLTAAYNDGTAKTVSSGFTCTPTTLNTAGTQTITVKYEGKTTSFTVSVQPVKPEKISVKTLPQKTSYYEGDTLDTNGLTLTVTYNNNTTQTVSGGFTCTPTALNTVGTQTITVKYEGQTTTFAVSVQSVEVEKISVKSLPTKTSYYVFESLNTSGLTLTVTYNNGTTKTVSSGFTCDKTLLPFAGTITVTVTYEGEKTSFTVTVKERALLFVSVKSMPTKTSYFVGEELDDTGLTLSAKYEGDMTAEVMEGFTCTPTTLNTVGTQTITVKYEGKTTTFTVSVQPVKLEKISVKTMPKKTSYYEGDTLDTNGLTLTATYNNGTTKTVSGGFTCTPTILRSDTQTITVEYEAKTTTFTVSVEPLEVTKISIKSLPTKTSYYERDTLNTSGLTLTATYNNGTTKTVSSGFTCTPTALNTPGTQTITVKYEGKTTTFTVSVQSLTPTRVSVKKLPTKTTYYVQETLNTNGLTLEVTYNNGTTQTVSSGFTCTPTAFSSVGNKTITVKYGSCTATFSVNVIADSIVNISSKSGSFRVLDTGVTITSCPSSATVGSYLYGLSVEHSWDRTPKSFTVKTNSSATKVTASSSNTSVVSVSVSQSGNVATITVTPGLIDYNITKTATVYIYLNGKQEATYSASVYRPHSLTVTSSNSKLLYVSGNPFEGGSICPVGTSDDPTLIISSNVAYLTVTTYNGNTARCAVTINASQDYTPSQTFNIRSGAGTGYSVVGSLPAWTTVKISGCYWDGTRIWGGIYYNGVWGWVAVYDFSG